MHAAGDFTLSALLADHIREDDRVFSTLDSRVKGVTGLPFSIDTSDATDDAETAQSLTKDVGRWWWETLPEAMVEDIERTIVMMGFAVGELTWAPASATNTELRPTIHIHHLGNVKWNEERECMVLATVDGPVDVTPGDGRWVLFAPHGAQRPWMNGAIRSLAIPFLIRTFGRRDWARRSEIEGVGIRKAGIPENADEGDVVNFLNAIKRLGAESTIRLPPGFTFDIATAEASAAEGFQKLINHCDSAITLVLLGQNLTTQIEGGSFAASKTHARTLLTRLAAAVATLATSARRQVVIPWGRFNKPNWNDDAAPWPRWNPKPAEDVQSEATALISLSQALTALRDQGIDIQPLVEKFDLKLVDAAAGRLPEIRAYHMDRGVVTINEVRERLKLEPVPDGDKLITPAGPTAANNNANPAE